MPLPERQRRAYLQRMGIDVWERADKPPPAPPIESVVEATEPPAGAAAPAVATLDWEALREGVLSCTACALHEGRTQAVFGVGNRRADWVVVGEAPGSEEDRRGEPFVGRAGQLLDAMLRAAGFDRQQVYIANILKCRPPNNRDPRPEEAACCEPYLRRQLDLLQPKLVLAVGRVAAQNLLKTEQPIGRLRGRVHEYGEDRIPVVVTYHPAYLLRSLGEKRKAWQDLQLAMRCHAGHGEETQ